MSLDDDTQRSEADAELERDLRREWKFNLAEATGRLADPRTRTTDESGRVPQGAFVKA